MGADRVSGVGLIASLFFSTVVAHVALPDPLPFTLMLACLFAIGWLWAVPVPVTPVPVRSRRAVVHRTPGRHGAPLDDEIAGLEAELHTLVDQYRTEVASEREMPTERRAVGSTRGSGPHC